MTILIDGKPATLAEDMSFEYVSENRLFTDADDYTLSLTFPLADCPGNLQIFGNIDRVDVSVGKVVFDCVIQDPALVKTGALVITEVNEREVTAQFLSGRSALNYDTTLDDVYIDELYLDEFPYPLAETIQVEDAWDPDYTGGDSVALPWVNNTSGNIQNCFIIGEDGTRQWHPDTEYLSGQPYLVCVAINIAREIGYKADFTEWLNHPSLRWLLLCNTLPAAWEITNFARALPHWSVKEFFANLEPLLGAEFEFDHKAKTIDIVMLQPTSEASRSVVQIDKVISEHTTEVSAIDEESEYRGAKNIVFADRDDTEWAYEACDWYIRANKDKAVKFDTFDELWEHANSMRTWDGMSGHRGIVDNRHNLLYTKDVDAYFVMRAIEKILVEVRWPEKPNRYRYTLQLQPVNMLAGRIVDPSEDATELKLEVAPVRKDVTGVYTGQSDTEGEDDYGRMMFLKPAEYGEDDPELDGAPSLGSAEDYIKDINDTFYQTAQASAIEGGKKDGNTEYYDKLYLGYWDGNKAHGMINPVPVTARFEPNDLLSVARFPYSLSPGDPNGLASGIYGNIQKGIKCTFKFLAESLPDVRASFLIRGKKYLCGKLTATFTTQGISQLITGEFYPLVPES